MPRRKNPTDLATRPVEDAIASAENLKLMQEDNQEHGHPYKRLSALAALAIEDEDYPTAKGAIAELLARQIPPLRSLEVESETKPLAVTFNIDLSKG